MAIKVNSCTIVTDSRQLQNIANYNNSSTSFFAGQCAGQSITTGTDNTLIGACAGRLITAGSSNLFFGTNAGCAVTTGVSNTIIGSVSGTSDLSNTVILAAGTCERLKVDSTGLFINGSVFTGGGANLTSCYNFFVTCGTPSSSMTGCNNIVIGLGAGCCLTFNASNNNFIGKYAGFGNTGGDNNNFFGTYTGCISSGSNNNFFGSFAGRDNTGNNNNFFGASSGVINTGSNNNFIGNGAGQVNTSGNHNNFFGQYSGNNNTTGGYNTFVGFCAGFRNSFGRNNFIAGRCAGLCNTSGSYNVFIGDRAGFRNTTGSCNNYFGFQVANCGTTATNNNILGTQGGYCTTSAVHNNLLGFQSGYSITTGSNNQFFGQMSGRSTTTGFQNIFAGMCAGYCNTCGSNNILIGCNSGVGSIGLANITLECNRIIMGNNAHTCAQIQIAWTAVSDVRDKCIFGPVPHGKGFLNQINPITFSFKNRETDTVTDIKKRYGFSAQEILSLEGNDPVLVGNDNPDKLGLTSEYLIPILVNAIKEMSQEIDTLKANQETMLTEINLLKAKIT